MTNLSVSQKRMVELELEFRFLVFPDDVSHILGRIGACIELESVQDKGDLYSLHQGLIFTFYS